MWKARRKVFISCQVRSCSVVFLLVVQALDPDEPVLIFLALYRHTELQYQGDAGLNALPSWQVDATQGLDKRCLSVALISRNNNPGGFDIFLPSCEGVDAVVQLDEGADIPIRKGL